MPGVPVITIDALDIDDATLDKIEAKHSVTFEEAEEAVFAEERHIRRGREGFYEVWSRTEAGRYLLVVLAPRRAGAYAIVTARGMTDSEQGHYRKAMGMR